MVSCPAGRSPWREEASILPSTRSRSVTALAQALATGAAEAERTRHDDLYLRVAFDIDQEVTTERHEREPMGSFNMPTHILPSNP